MKNGKADNMDLVTGGGMAQGKREFVERGRIAYWLKRGPAEWLVGTAGGRAVIW